MKFLRALVLLLPLVAAWPEEQGLNQDARDELEASGMFKYLGEFSPVAEIPLGEGWVQYTFDPFNGKGPSPTEPPEGPVCIVGTPYSVYTKAGDPHKLLIYLQGGGACWENKYRCFLTADSELQKPPYPQRGINLDSDDNPFRDYTIVTLPFCDGSVFVGDNDIVGDTQFEQYVLSVTNQTGATTRFHRGVRNLSAGMDLAKALFPSASKVVIAGSSAGGVGAQVFSPFLARELFGNSIDLLVLNDSGPLVTNLKDTVAVKARADDWKFDQFFPEGCEECDSEGQLGTAVINWRLTNDMTVKESFYSSDGDYVNRFSYLGYIPGVDFREEYRDLIVEEHGELHCSFPDRYKRFILTDDSDHTVLFTDDDPPTPDPLYTKTADDEEVSIVLNEWIGAFVNHEGEWVDIVEEFVEVYPNAEIQDLPPPNGFGVKCTNCWCKPEDGPDGKCPELDNREISYGADVIMKFKSFTPVGMLPALNPPGCTPYVALTLIPPYPPLCIPPTSLGDHAVCAYVYDTNDCSTRNETSVKTYMNAYEANKAGAIIIHEGDCGVCSSANDLVANMDPQLDRKSAACGILIETGGPQAAVQCFMTEIGFTLDCAQLWVNNAISTAISPLGCRDICVAFQQNPTPPNDPQTCDLNDCLACDEEASGEIFQQFAGLTRRKAGIITPVIRDCSAIANIGQDPCKTSNQISKGSKGQKGNGSKGPKQSKGGSNSCKGTKGGNGKAKGKASKAP